MAYVSTEKKAKIAAALKAVVPADWKYTLAVRHHSTIVMTIRKAPINLLTEIKGDAARTLVRSGVSPAYANLGGCYHIKDVFEGKTLETFQKIRDALNTDNYDRSDSQSDHFDIGHYVDVHIGKWDKPFICTAEA